MDRPGSPVVITGGAQRLGLAAALALNAAGYEVVISYRKPRALLAKLQRNGIACIRADFSEDAGIFSFADELRRRYQSLRAIIHNASEWQAEDGEHENHHLLQRMLNIHVAAPYLLNQECGDMLMRHGELRGFADIIHMSDYVASSGSSKHIAYAASKAALDNLMLSFAKKYAPLVKVNSIAPAMLMFNHEDDATYRKKSQHKSLLGIAPGEAEGVNAIRYLLESRYLTGKTIALDGGRHLAQAS